MAVMDHADIAILADPAHTALCVVECQNGVIGPESSVPALAEAAAGGLIPRVAALAAAARAAGVKVVHCVAMIHPDGWGANRNARLFGVARRSKMKQVPGSAAVEPVAEIGVVEGSDVVVARFHGLSPTSATGLDAMLRNEGIATVVVAGVSLNLAVPNTVFDLVNGGFQVVVPTDAVIGTPVAYGEMVLEHTLSYVATLTDVETLAGAWSAS